MANEPAPPQIRRVVTGHDGQGRSCVIFDSAAPNAKKRPGSYGTYYVELWTIDDHPADISGNKDDGWVEKPVEHSPPANGARFRIPRPGQGGDGGSGAALTEEELEKAFVSMNTSGMSERREDANHWHMHRSRTVDYAMALNGEGRFLLLDESKTQIFKGDVVIQLANFHAWETTPGSNSPMAYDMIGSEWPDD